MAKSKKRTVKAKAKGAAKTKRAAVKAKRVARAKANLTKRMRKAAPKSVEQRDAENSAFLHTGLDAEHVVVPPDTDSGVSPSEEKDILNALTEAEADDDDDDNDDEL